MEKAVLFDMDGVLIDSQPIHYEADRLALLEQGVTVVQKELEKYAGTTTEKRFALFQEEFHFTGDVKKQARRREEIIKKLFQEEEIPLVAGVETVLEHCKEMRWKMAVASSTSHDIVEFILEKIGVRHYFLELVSGEEVACGKPAPDIFLEAAKRLQVSHKDCLVVEDSENGVLAGKAAAMRVLGYKNPTTGIQDLSHADIVIEDFRTADTQFLKKLMQA